MSREAEESGRLKKVLKQALARNKAIERQALWKRKHSEDHGSATSLTLKTNEGEVHSLAVIPANAEVTRNSVNKFEQERKRLASQKEDVLLDRLCDGQDHAWRPDSFFSVTLGEDEVPWPVRPTDFFTNPHYADRIVAAYEASKAKASKKRRKEKAEKKHKKHRKEKRERPKLTEKEKKRKDKDKKSKKNKKRSTKDEGKKGKKRKKKKKRRRKRSDASSDNTLSQQRRKASRTTSGEDSEPERAEEQTSRSSSADPESAARGGELGLMARPSAQAGSAVGVGDASSSSEPSLSSDLEVVQVLVARS